MNELLEAADGYVPLVSTLLWVGLVAGLAYFFRKQLIDVLNALKDRIAAGASVKLAGLEVGKLITKLPT